MLGLEYALALAFSELVDGGEMTEEQVLASMSWRPAAIAGMQNHGQRLVAGAPANLCVIDPSQRWVIDATGGASLSRNVPYVGKEVRGKVRHTMVFGELVVRDGEVQR
jgi:dihydroorotase